MALVTQILSKETRESLKSNYICPAAVLMNKEIREGVISDYANDITVMSEEGPGDLVEYMKPHCDEYICVVAELKLLRLDVSADMDSTEKENPLTLEV